MKKIIYAAFMLLLATNYANASEHSWIDIFANKITVKTKNLNPHIVKLAIKAFSSAQVSGVHITKPILTIIDYTLPSTYKRLWVIDIARKKILYNSLVAHGKYSGENYTTNFSNRINSLQTSVGLFLTENTYLGRYGYSLRLQGLEKGFNDNAKVRAIVFHGAPYVNKKFAATVGRIGRSWGCPAVEPKLATPIINTIKDGTLIFSFSNHPQWLNQSKFIKSSQV